jgi:hypothetical protein
MKSKFFFKAGKVNVSDTRGLSGGLFAIFEKWIAASPYDYTGHDELLEKIAAENRLDFVKVKHLGIRFYYMYSPQGIIISGCREADNQAFIKRAEFYSQIIKKNNHLF